MGKYRRCKSCKELISAHHEDCPNCTNRDALRIGRSEVGHGLRGRPTLDIQEGNLEEM